MNTLAIPAFSKTMFATKLPLLSVLLLTALVLHPTHAEAESPGTTHARTARLAGFSTGELAQLRPYLAQGPVALVEFADSDADELPAINVVQRVKAPLSRLLAIVSSPASYPRFLRTLDGVEVRHRGPRSVAYDWSLDVSLLKLTGRNLMRVYKGSDTRGHRVTIDCLSGDFGTGRIAMRLLPEGGHSLLVVSVRLDLRTANYLARQAAKASRSVNRSANMALAYSMALGLAAEAEQGEAKSSSALPKAQPADAKAPGEASAKTASTNAAKTLLPLLDRGDLVTMALDPKDGLQSVQVFGRIHQPQALVQSVLSDAHGLGASLLPGSEAEIVDQNSDRVLFDWSVDIPLIGVSGRMVLRPSAEKVTVHALEGALKGGHWVLATDAIQPALTFVHGDAAFDVRETNFVLRGIADKDPNLGHGMAAAGQVMLLRALRTRSGDAAKQRSSH